MPLTIFYLIDFLSNLSNESFFPEAEGGKKWRNDNKCGSENTLPDGTSEFAQCNPDGEKPCCNSVLNGECGNTTEHCSCRNCTDYKFEKWWRESGGIQMWRNDGKCGKYYPLPNGTAAQCDPDGEKPCCHSVFNGECGNTTEHCSCRNCTDYKFEKWWRESGDTQMWRNDGKCGKYYPLPNGKAAQCDPDGESPCCSDGWDGECGNTTEHCSCYICTNFKFIYRDWKESDGQKKWRNDGICGEAIPFPDGTAAVECNPDGENPCCSDEWDGEGGNTTEHCSCWGCTDYMFAKWWRESGGIQMWRNDGKCGKNFPLPNGTAAQCDPDGENPCCDSGWDGECGNTTEHCSCEGCTDFKFARWWRESGGTQMWRNDGKCGKYYTLPNGTAAQCDPDGENPCCSDGWDGECGNTTEHCSCWSCTDYKFDKWWRESGGTQMWRNDGKCGENFPLPNGIAAQCDPDGEKPCCSSGWGGECGNTTEHCSCRYCIDFKFEKWLKESGDTNNMWRNDGKCGENFPLPNGTAAQCDPDGEKPCCSSRWYGECGNTTEHCSCQHCTDYKFEKWWRESGGTQMWRNDGKCGEYYPLPNGTAAECDPDGENPCCDSSWYGECSNGDKACFSEHCTNFKLVKHLKVTGQNCTIVRLESAFLKYVCLKETSGEIIFRCAHSDTQYSWYPSFHEFGGMSVSKVCENDPFVYQACGLKKRMTGPDVLCGGYFCEHVHYYKHTFYECPTDDCKAGGRNCKASENDKLLCDDKCDQERCSDESDCNGYKYRLHGQWEEKNPDSNLIDETVRTCTNYTSIERYKKELLISNDTKCLVFDSESSLFNPYCLDYSDQINCSDIERVGGYCNVNSFMSSVSKYVLCHDYDEITNLAVKICDDDLQNNCLNPTTTSDCRIHKHKMCDGVKDCPDGSDEIHDMCRTMTDELSFNCQRAFNTRNGITTIPFAWISDRITDCMNGEDEDLSKWQFCEGEFRQILAQGQKCQNAFKCSRDKESYVPFDQLCDGVESCDNGGENEVCRIARDFPIINKTASYSNTAKNVCDRSNCEIREFKVNSKTYSVTEIFGVSSSSELLVPTSKVKCDSLFGEYYLFLSCMNLCLEVGAICPLDNVDQIIMHDSCPGQFPNRSYTLADNSFLTFVVESGDGHYHQQFFQCENSRCIEYKQVCDLVDDCGDMSDEINCTNHMICEDTLNSSKHQFIALSQKCDGIYDCFDLSDECNDNCGRQILSNWYLKGICWSMGTLALLFNLFTVAYGFASLKHCETKSMMTSKALMSIIGVGDLLIGLYLVIISVFDSIIFGTDFCKHQAEWLTGTTCLALGIISTLGSQISLFTMTALSVIRFYGLTCKPMRVPGPVNKRSIVKLILSGFITIGAAVMIAVIPLVPALEDLFVQGMFYDPTYKVFVGFPNKERHVNILRSYYDQNETFNSTNLSTKMSWKEIGEKVDGMFTQNEGILSRRPVHFYGNDGLCLFKYFVRTDDARRSRQSIATGAETTAFIGDQDPVVWTMLTVNLCCFIVITCCYIVITWKTKQSSQRSGQSDNQERQTNERAIQNKIMMIIATDFLCWVPFIVISALHNLAYIDASTWYSMFAMTVLPLNSVINPLVYDKALNDTMRHSFGRVNQSLRQGTLSLRRLNTEIFRTFSAVEEEVEPEVITLERVDYDNSMLKQDNVQDNDHDNHVGVNDDNEDVNETD